MKDFNALTTRGRARRLRQLAETALSAYDLDVQRIRLVNNISNCTFRVDATDGGSYALRINLPELRTRDEIRSELTWQEAVARETDVAPPLPIRTRAGDLVVEASAPGVPEARLCNVSTWIRGTMLTRSRTPENFERLGNLVARLHQHGASYRPAPDFSVPVLDEPLPEGLPDLLFAGESGYDIPPTARVLMEDMKSALETELTRLYTSRKPQIIHGDIHFWNVLVYRGMLHPIDFEDCALAFPIQDIAITFYYVLWNDRYVELLNAFRAGYEKCLLWPEEYPGQLDLLMGQRALDLVNLLLNSTYDEDRELIPEFIGIIDGTYRRHFERLQLPVT